MKPKRSNGKEFRDPHLHRIAFRFTTATCVYACTQRVRSRSRGRPYETCAPRGKAASAIRRRSAIRSIEENVADSLRWLQLLYKLPRRLFPPRRHYSTLFERFPESTRLRFSFRRRANIGWPIVRDLFRSRMPQKLSDKISVNVIGVPRGRFVGYKGVVFAEEWSVFSFVVVSRIYSRDSSCFNPFTVYSDIVI